MLQRFNKVPSVVATEPPASLFFLFFSSAFLTEGSRGCVEGGGRMERVWRTTEKKLPIRSARGLSCRRCFTANTNPATPTQVAMATAQRSVHTSKEKMKQQQTLQQPNVECFISLSSVFNFRSLAAGSSAPWPACWELQCLLPLQQTVDANEMDLLDLLRFYS